MNHLSRKVFLAAVTAAVLSPVAAEELSLSRFSAQKFKLDGNFDDKIWGEAASIPSFRLCNFGKEKEAPSIPRNNTSFRAYYDQDALCFAFSLKDSRPEKIIPGLPKGQTDNVPIASGSDVLEMFISSPCQECLLPFAGCSLRGCQLCKNTISTGRKTGIPDRQLNPGPWERRHVRMRKAGMPTSGFRSSFFRNRSLRGNSAAGEFHAYNFLPLFLYLGRIFAMGGHGGAVS